MDVLDALDADGVRAWSRLVVGRLDEHRQEINALNVFPVPDSDTGSNLLTTFRAADSAITDSALTDSALTDSAITDSAITAAELLDLMASGAARSAAGNSGFIASQILRGLADAAAGADRCDARALAAGLSAGASLGRSAVVEPVEGTILTVARAASDAASEPGERSLAELARAAFDAAQTALDLTTGQLPELAQAGVVDAGGRGLVIVLQALVEVVTGAPAALDPVRTTVIAGHLSSATGFGFEVQYLLEARADAVDRLRDALDVLGDSVAVVATGDGRWNVHAHVDDVGAAIEAGVDAGRPHAISVVRFADTHPTVSRSDRDSHDHAGGSDTRGVAVVAVAPGYGLAHLFEREGVAVVEGSADDLPGVDEVIAAIEATGARDIVLLPNASRVTGVAESAAERVRDAGSGRVTVVPTRSPVQGLAAVAVHDSHRRFDDDVVAMAEAAAATRYAEISVARDQALTAVGICERGDVLGLIDGEVVEIGRGIVAVGFALVDRLLGVGVELMTIVVGDGAPARIGEQLEAHVRGRSSFTDVVVFPGGQLDHPVIIGAE